jgi:hypothetical protein
MTHYAGIDVSLETSSICIVDGAGAVVREKAESKPDALEHRYMAEQSHQGGSMPARPQFAFRAAPATVAAIRQLQALLADRRGGPVSKAAAIAYAVERALLVH